MRSVVHHPLPRILLVLAVLALATVLWRPSERRGGATDQPPVAAMPAPLVDDARAENPASRPSASTPLPPQHGPLRGRLGSLYERARAGQPQAACRLAIELNACRGLLHREKLSDMLAVVAAIRPPSPADEDVVDTVASAREGAAAGAQHCAGIDSENENDSLELFQSTVLNGTIRQKVVAALLQPDGSLLRLPRGPGTIMPMDIWFSAPASQFYADHALTFLREGYYAHDPLALEGLILVHAPDLLQPSASMDVAFRLPDPRRFAGLALLAERLYGPEMLGSQVRNLLQRVLEGLPETSRTQLQQQVDAESSAWLNAAAPPLANENRLSPELLDELCR